MYTSFKPIVEQELKTIEEAGLHKEERVISSRQGRTVRVGEKELLNFCANNYLGMAGSDEMVQAAKEALDKYGYGFSSALVFCGTPKGHKERSEEDTSEL